MIANPTGTRAVTVLLALLALTLGGCAERDRFVVGGPDDPVVGFCYQRLARVDCATTPEPGRVPVALMYRSMLAPIY
ncbi:hypothetical protein [Oceanibacterium hippocampi]|uniref:Uncharacterized protein n=1 Tax=Oceanibacterium hippocampi TaxID=745714 RepID=A0A1Y5S7S0_9PROT|nr:hypothetical protein [Oceanibacterium hippocampi]SLN32081.1 hypothetical protein OCH7691_01173 [Oceanibacterium hippocampi]